MKGEVYQYPMKKNFKYHRWFITYEDKKHRYTEENFDLRMEAEGRIKELSKKGIEAELWTRERALSDNRLR